MGVPDASRCTWSPSPRRSGSTSRRAWRSGKRRRLEYLGGRDGAGALWGWCPMTLHDATRRWLVAGLVAGLVLAASVTGVGAQAPGADQTSKVATDQATALAKQQQNPISSLISVPLQGNWDFGLGDRDATGTLFNIQPVVPFGVSRSTNLILRVILPLASQPGSGDARVNGVGDVVMTAFFSPAKSGRFTWGRGRSSCCRRRRTTRSAARSSASGHRRWSSPSRDPGRSACCSTTSGPPAAPTTARTSVRPSCSRSSTTTCGNGLAVGAVLEATANWNADEHWTAPLVFTVSKVARLGNRPVNFVAGAGPTVASPEGGSTWRFRVMAVFLFPR
ncbi:MAG: hypothetical protein MZV64_04905 [Ignavibacteriales bacterium]|nr:hypothetical protein [Ignavibacteriales bacterium]